MTFCSAFSTINWLAIKDIVSVFGTLSALVLGIAGLTTWRRQLQGTTEYDVAKRTLLLTFQVQDALQAVRSPMLYLRSEEIEKGRKLEEEQRIYNERLQRLHEKWAELRTVSLEARVIWGERVDALFPPIRKLIGDIQAEIWLHFWLRGAFAGPGSVDNNPERVSANDKIVYCTSDSDEFSKRIEAAVCQIENFFKTRLHR